MGFEIAQAFYYDHSEVIPVPGGDYVEGAVGEVGPLNPLLVQQGSIAHDITQLIFSGLSQYDPQTGEIVPDLADFTVSSNGKEYTFVLKEGVKWHDGEPITADDVIFTYNNLITNPEFSGAVLSYNDYTGVKVSKIDERTVQFLLENPDSFFLVKTMVGLLPEHLLRDIPVGSLANAPFNFAPVGSGPYQFSSEATLLDHREYNLLAFEDYYGEPLSIETMTFKVFSSLEDLKANLDLLDGIRNLPSELRVELNDEDQFTLVSYHLPQYVALFINTESELLQDSKVRLGLQLGTNKEEIIDALGEEKTIDTPLLEIEQEDWRLLYDVKRANGALFDTQWEIPNKEVVEGELAEAEAEVTPQGQDEEIEEESDGTPEYIQNPNGGEDWTTAQSSFIITGSAPEGLERIEVRGYELQEFNPGDTQWSYKVNEELYENLSPGENLYEVVGFTPEGDRRVLDSITVNYISQRDLSEAEQEEIFLYNQAAPPLPTRTNEEGELLNLNLITTENPEAYQEIARLVQQQWKKIGVGVDIEVLDPNTFQKRLTARNYDLLLFGQPLGYNLDAYPYWHSSQVKEGGLNLSQFKDFRVDTFLERARLEQNEEARLQILNELQEILVTEVPAIFLYSPTYHFALSSEVQNVTFNNLATTTDRLAGIERWSSQVKRQWNKEVGFFTFFPWIIHQF